MFGFIDFGKEDVAWVNRYIDRKANTGKIDKSFANTVKSQLTTEIESGPSPSEKTLSDDVTKELDSFVFTLHAAYRKRVSRHNRAISDTVTKEECSFTIKSEIHEQLRQLSTDSEVTMSQKIEDLVSSEWIKQTVREKVGKLLETRRMRRLNKQG